MQPSAIPGEGNCFYYFTNEGGEVPVKVLKYQYDEKNQKAQKKELESNKDVEK